MAITRSLSRNMCLLGTAACLAVLLAVVGPPTAAVPERTAATADQKLETGLPHAAAPMAARPDGPSAMLPSRTLSVEERVAYQRKIEEVYWRHRIWPKENPQPKPLLSEVMSDEKIAAKVDDYLRKSAALGSLWERPITADQLQAELDRMVTATRKPAVLKDLFAALDNDPFLIAECLARPVLADRLVRSEYDADERIHRDVRARAESAMAKSPNPSELRELADRYEEIEYVLSRGAEPLSGDLAGTMEGSARSTVRLEPEEWAERVRELASMWGIPGGSGASLKGASPGASDASVANAALASLPVGVVSPLEETSSGWRAVAVLSKANDAIRVGVASWPKRSFDGWWSETKPSIASISNTSGAAYTLGAPSAQSSGGPDTWRPTSMVGAPPPRRDLSAVWTGTEMIVWGGGTPTTVLTQAGCTTPRRTHGGRHRWSARPRLAAATGRSGRARG